MPGVARRRRAPRREASRPTCSARRPRRLGGVLRHDRGGGRRDAPAGGAVVLSFACSPAPCATSGLGGRSTRCSRPDAWRSPPTRCRSSGWPCCRRARRRPGRRVVVLSRRPSWSSGACWALDRWWGTGPLEWVVHRSARPQPAARTPGPRRTEPAAPAARDRLGRSVGEVPRAREVHRDAGGLAAATTSASRIDPPGATTARTPASRSTWSPSANGKKASDAATAPRARSLPGARHGEVARVDPVDLAHADADRGAAAGEQDGVGLHRPARPARRTGGRRGWRRRRGRRRRGASAAASSPPVTGRPRPRRRRPRHPGAA